MAGPAEIIFEAFATHGVIGAVAGALLLWVWRKEKEIAEERKALAEERAARIKDAKDYNDLSLKLQANVIGAVNKMGDIFDEAKKIMLAERNRGRSDE